MMEDVSGIAILVSYEVRWGVRLGGLGRDLGIFGIGRPTGPLPDAVPLSC